MSVTKFLSAAEAAALIKNGDAVAVSGNGAGMIAAEAILAAVEKRFLETGEPRDLTLVHSLGLGDRGDRGVSRFAHEGMTRRVIAASSAWKAPRRTSDWIAADSRWRLQATRTLSKTESEPKRRMF